MPHDPEPLRSGDRLRRSAVPAVILDQSQDRDADAAERNRRVPIYAEQIQRLGRILWGEHEHRQAS